MTSCVKQLEELEKYTKEIVGEQGYSVLLFSSPTAPLPRPSSGTLLAEPLISTSRFDHIDTFEFDNHPASSKHAHSPSHSQPHAVLDGGANDSRS